MGPTYKSIKVKNNKVYLSLSHADGLKSRDRKTLNWFTLAGKDGIFEAAEAVIEGNKLVLSSAKVNQPVQVCFAWHEEAQPNLINGAGLPAVPFRTDNAIWNLKNQINMKTYAKLSILQIAVFLIALLFSVNSFTQTKIYIAINGSDQNLGSLSNPLASIGKAVDRAKITKGKVEIIIRKGTYYLSKPIVFSSDEKLNYSTLSIKSYKDEKVVISGAKKLKLDWTSYKNSIMETKISDNLKFDELFVNGVLMDMARYPNYNSKAKYLGGTAADAISVARIKTWGNPAGGYVHALHQSLWGGFSYEITGVNAKGEAVLEGGWQNNRKMGMHKSYQFVENVFEEMDTINEWFFKKQDRKLYFFPKYDLNLKTAVFESPQIKSLIEFRGDMKKPIRNITLEGLEFTQTLRTFMDNKEQLLRSDWTTYRGGAVFYQGAQDCKIINCVFNQVGGNAVYYSNFNQNNEISGCHIYKAGGNGICFVGDPNAVRSPSFEYNEFVPFRQLDLIPGPKTDNYPAKCLVYNNLIEEIGEIEIQSAAVQISMSQDITISHNTIDNLPRAGINISEGTWGGHILEYNDVFNTVQESGDHGSFNSWGRDRYWHPNKATLDTIVEKYPEIVQLDVVKPIIIRNNRFRCDHGWDVDLDDGSSNYRIYNNLFLNGGLKLREGYNRIVENNIMVNNTFHPHVWFKNSEDVFTRNIVFERYMPIGMPKTKWGKQIDYNIFMSNSDLSKSKASSNADEHSIVTNADFIAPEKGDYRLKSGSAAFSVGFKNFDMDSFGVVSPHLKLIAKKVVLPEIKVKVAEQLQDEILDFLGLKLKNLNTLGEQSATGMAETSGALVLEVSQNSKLSSQIKRNDVILNINSKDIKSLNDIKDMKIKNDDSGDLTVIIFRNQKQQKITFRL